MAYGTNKKKKSISNEVAQEAISSMIAGGGMTSMSKKKPKPTKVRTRTHVRQGGAVVKTKTVTKGGGMKRVERTKTRDNALGSFSSRSVFERGPKGKIGMTEFKGVTPFGEAYGYKAEKMKMGGRKTVASKYYDVEGTDVLSKQKGKGYKTKTVKITDADGRTIVKKKGRGSRMQLMSKPIKKSM